MTPYCFSLDRRKHKFQLPIQASIGWCARNLQAFAEFTPGRLEAAHAKYAYKEFELFAELISAGSFV
jgi:hypothetical protein